MLPAPQLLLETPRFRIVREWYRTSAGAMKTRELMRHPGAVVIAPLLDDGRVCLIRNWRLSVQRTLVELPAGTLEPGEPPAATAARELEEETGYRAANLEFLHAFYVAPGVSDEKMHLYLATSLKGGLPRRETGEEIENLEVPLDEAVEMIFRGEIEDAKTIVGLLWMLRRVRQS
jgi:ADP-ribose pyrophosphatase